MSTTPVLPSYTEVMDELKKSPVKYNASQVHGLLCGLLCSPSEQLHEKWEKILFGEKHLKNKATLEQLFEITHQQLSEFSFEFSLLLPGDDADINDRTEALGLWCQGFLTGLEHAKIPIQHRKPSDITEALNDIIEISQVNFGDIADDEEDETAYFELVEYVRLAVLMIFQDLRSNNSPTTTSEQPVLH